MSITFISTATRPTTSTPFYVDSGLPVVTRQTQALADAGVGTTEVSYSPDQLTRIAKATFSSESEFEQYYNLLADISLGKEYADYIANTGCTNTREIVLDANKKLVITTTYSWSGEIDTSTLVHDLQSSVDLTDLQVLSNSIIAVHTNSDMASFTESHWNDFSISENLLSLGVTKTISVKVVD